MINFIIPIIIKIYTNETPRDTLCLGNNETLLRQYHQQRTDTKVYYVCDPQTAIKMILNKLRNII